MFSCDSLKTSIQNSFTRFSKICPGSLTLDYLFALHAKRAYFCRGVSNYNCGFAVGEDAGLLLRAIRLRLGPGSASDSEPELIGEESELACEVDSSLASFELNDKLNMVSSGVWTLFELERGRFDGVRNEVLKSAVEVVKGALGLSRSVGVDPDGDNVGAGG